MGQSKVQNYLSSQGCEWIFNLPHVSHLGAPNRNDLSRSGRHVPTARKQSADAWTFSDTHGWSDCDSPSDTDEPQPLSPAMLLTMKSRPVGPPPGESIPPDVYAWRQWRRVQYLAVVHSLSRVNINLVFPWRHFFWRIYRRLFTGELATAEIRSDVSQPPCKLFILQSIFSLVPLFKSYNFLAE